MSAEKPTERGRRETPIKHTVAALRAVSGLSQEQLARLVGVSRSTIQAIELGNLKLSGKLARSIALETGVSDQWLLEGDPALPPRASDGADYMSMKHFLFQRAERERRSQTAETEEAMTLDRLAAALAGARFISQAVHSRLLLKLKVFVEKLEIEVDDLRSSTNG